MEVKTAQNTGLRTATPAGPRRTTRCRCWASTTSSSTSATRVQAAHFFTHALGFRETAFAGLETGMRDRSSRVVEQGRIRFVLTAPLHGGSEIARHLADHGDGVKVVALSVPDAEEAYRVAVRRGARGLQRAAHRVATSDGKVKMSHDRHLRRDRPHLRRARRLRGRLPARLPAGRSDGATTTGMFAGIDHVVGNVELGRMEEWVGYYERVFGFTEMIRFTDEDISTEYSALMSKVMADGNGRIKFPINEPAEGERKSQIEEYLEFYGGPGVQHIALSTTDIVATVRELQERGVRFLAHPRQLLRGAARARSARSTRTWTTCASSASSPTATTRATCCRSSRSRWATARPCSSR